MTRGDRRPAPASGIVTLTTDFGTHGPYVAAMKGIILGMAPRAVIVDVSHEIAPQNILEGAFVLSGVVDAFPLGTIHLAVVDPGVGTPRRLAAARAGGHWFVGPDNGLMSGVTRGRERDEAYQITNPAIFRPDVSATFHGRDILAPAAAHLLLGGSPSDLGPALDAFEVLPNLEPRDDGAGLVGEVVFRDAFGNLITNVSAERLAGHRWRVEVAGARIDGLCRTYGDRPIGSLVALVGSTRWVEIAVVNGDAARQLSAGPGTTVWFRRLLDRP